MKLLYGTGNQGKIKAMQRALKDLNLEIVGLKEYTGQLSQEVDYQLHGDDQLRPDKHCQLPAVKEDGLTPLENARIKAAAYYETFHIPVFSCDSGLYFEGVPEEYQPGVFVRRIEGKELSDDEMIEYYSSLAKHFGTLKARYRNAISFILDEEHIYESTADNLSGQAFYIVDTPHVRRMEGFPLDSLSVHIDSGLYYYDLENNGVDEIAVDKGFYEFFQKVLSDG